MMADLLLPVDGSESVETIVCVATTFYEVRIQADCLSVSK
jgi:hypothetical protein